MRRREFLGALGCTAAVWPVRASAQQPKKLPRLCFLAFDPASSQSTRFAAFFEGLSDLGYVHGQTITIDYLTAEGRPQRYLELAAECVRLGADVITTNHHMAGTSAPLVCGG
jgi:putative ABC transport system substrate-binding protein